MSGIFTGKHISEVVAESITEIEERKLGLTSKGLKSRWEHLNSFMGGGFQKGYNYLVAGLSGSGKSTIANIIETDIFDLNTDEDIIVLNFNFETPSIMNLMKKYSSDIGMTVNEVLSSDAELTDEALITIKHKSERYNKYPIYYFDVSGTADDIRNTVVNCRVKNPDTWIFCIIDHTTLVTPRNHESELELVTYLANMSVKIKKQTGATFLWLGQLNSNIEQIERLTNPALHAPMRSDLFGGKSIFNAMDCIFMPHRPELLKIARYTMEELDTKNKMFFHIVKQRFGKLGTVEMDTSELGLNKIKELRLL